MKLLFHQNISYRILRKVSFAFPEAKQIREIGLENKSDKQIWDFARENNFTIVTFDADFFELSNLFGTPPKIIWIRTGNRKTDDLAELLISKVDFIKDFLSNPAYDELACLEIDE